MKNKIRPTLKVGDIVKLSKKGKNFPRTFPVSSTLVVSKIQGDGIDHSSIITCRVSEDGSFRYHNFYRSELWTTGRNAFTKDGNKK